jgi:hypothetical protein
MKETRVAGTYPYPKDAHELGFNHGYLDTEAGHGERSTTDVAMLATSLAQHFPHMGLSGGGNYLFRHGYREGQVAAAGERDRRMLVWEVERGRGMNPDSSVEARMRKPNPAHLENPGSDPSRTHVVATIRDQLLHAGLSRYGTAFVYWDENTLKVSKGLRGALIRYNSGTDLYDVTPYDAGAMGARSPLMSAAGVPDQGAGVVWDDVIEGVGVEQLREVVEPMLGGRRNPARWPGELYSDEPLAPKGFYVYAVPEGPGMMWHSEPYPTREAAQAWIDGYQVSQAYKDAHYRIMPVEEYWAKFVLRKGSRGNPASSPEQYRLAQAVLSGTARGHMPVAVAREIVERTPAGLRSEYSAYRANPSGVIDHGQVYVKADEEENLPACYVHRLSVPVDDTKTRARVELDGYVYGWEYTIPETPYDGWPPPGAVRYAVYSREEPFGKEKGRKGNPEWLSFRVRPGDDPTDKAFDAGKYWARIGAYQSGVSNANVRKYGFNRWYNDQSPGGMYREGPPRRKLKKSTLERSFNGGYRIGKEEGRRSNPAGSAAALYETFHGIPSESETVITEQIQYHGNLAELGTLVEIKVETLSGYKAVLTFEPGPPLLCSSEDGKQLYIRGGEQSLDLDALHMSGDEWVRDSMVIGPIAEFVYRTRKGFDGRKKLEYFHKPGEETGVRPDLIYDVLNNQLSVSGGQYAVEDVGVVN